MSWNRFKPSSKIFDWTFLCGTSFVDRFCFSVLCLSCICTRLFICALWSPAGKGLTSWLSFVVSNCEFVTFPLVSWVRSCTWLYRFLIFTTLLTFNIVLPINFHISCVWSKETSPHCITGWFGDRLLKMVIDTGFYVPWRVGYNFRLSKLLEKPSGTLWSMYLDFTCAQYQLTNCKIRLFWPVCNMKDHLCSQLRPKAEEISCFNVTF